jgi:GAF domain-containing protein/Tfp pilus assembly protein PilZ
MKEQERLETALFQISAAIHGHKDLAKILELIVRESLDYLKAHRSTIFLIDGQSGILKSQCTYAMDPADEQVSLLEEKEVARKALRQMSPLLLREPKDFSDFFRYEKRSRKVSSILCIPLSSRGKPIGALSVVLINGKNTFNEKNLKSLSLFGNQASIAIENAHLQEEVRKGVSLRRTYEGYLDDILNQLQSISEEERGRIEEHIQRLMQGQKASQKPFVELQASGGMKEVNGDSGSGREWETDRRQEDRAEGMLRVEFADASLGLADELSPGGVFIRTPNPMELGEQFLLKLYMSDEGEPIEVTCKVIWTNKYGQESKHLRRGMGVKFLNLSNGVQKRIEKYIRSQGNISAGNIL